MLEMQVKWHKPFEYKLSHSTEWLSFHYHSTENLLKTSAFPEIFIFFLLCTSMTNSITRNKSENADGSSNSCLCGAWACHERVAGMTCLIRFCVDCGSYLLVFTGDAHKSRIMQVADKTLCYNYMWIPWNPQGEESEWTVGYSSSL